MHSQMSVSSWHKIADGYIHDEDGEGRTCAPTRYSIVHELIQLQHLHPQRGPLSMRLWSKRQQTLCWIRETHDLSYSPCVAPLLPYRRPTRALHSVAASPCLRPARVGFFEAVSASGLLKLCAESSNVAFEAHERRIRPSLALELNQCNPIPAKHRPSARQPESEKGPSDSLTLSQTYRWRLGLPSNSP